MSTKFDGAVALIRHPGDEAGRWLTRLDKGSGTLKLIMTERLEGESPRESLDRELSWQLRLNRGRDYLISSVARLHFEADLTIPGRDEPTAYCIEFFLVEPYGPRCRLLLLEDRDSVWLSRSELLQGISDDGIAVCSECTTLLKAADVISHAE